MSSNEINENEIEDELNDYNLPIITVKYYFDNDIIYQKTFSKNATFGDCVKDFEKSLENNENEEDISKINYSFKNENIDPNKKIIDVVETEKNTVLLEIEIGLQIQNLNTSNYKKSLEKLNNNLPSSNNNLNQNLLLKNDNIQFNNKNNNNNNNIKNILSPTINPFKIINYSPKESKINLYNFDPKIINEYKLNDFNQSSACVNTPNNLYLSGGINSNKVPIKNFWIIDNNKLNVNLKELPLPKSNHSMIYIPNNYIFFVGGNNKFTFYYNIKNNTFSKWADLNEIQLRPALYFDEETNELFCMSNYKDNFFIEKTNLTNFPEWEKIDVNIKDKPTFRNNFIIKKINQDKYLLIGNNNYIYDNELKEIREYNNDISPNKTGMQFLDKNLYKLNNYLDASIPKNFNDEKEIIIVNKKGDVKKVDFEQIENENIKKENLSFKTNDRKINGNINIKIKTQKVDANNNLDKIDQQNFDNLKNNNNLLYLNDNNNNTRNLKYNVELSIPKFNKSESKMLEKVKEDYVDNKPVIEDKLIEEVNEIKNEEDDNVNKYKILMKNVFEVHDYSDNVDREVIQSDEK
jgi:hypothetical protein